MYNFGGYQTQQESEENMLKEAMMVGGKKTPMETLRTTTVKGIIGLTKNYDGKGSNVFNAKLKVLAEDIGVKDSSMDDKTRKQLLGQITIVKLEETEKGVEGKKIVLEKIIGEIENTHRETFDIFSLELHKKGLSPKKRMEQIRNLPHFEETRKLVLKGIGSVEWDLLDIENKLPGAKGLS